MNITTAYLYTSDIAFLFMFGIWSKSGGGNILFKFLLLLLGVAGLFVALKG